jgi:hypothetical protein
MRLLTFAQSDARKWNEIMLSSQSGTLFHTWEWLKIVERHTQSKLLPLVFFDADDNIPFGTIPLFSMKTLGLKMIFSPPPGVAITLGPTKTILDSNFIRYDNYEIEICKPLDSYLSHPGCTMSQTARLSPR